MKTLLILTDFSVNATYAAEYGYNLAIQMKASIVLCNVLNVHIQLPQVDITEWPIGGEDISRDFCSTELMDLKKHLEYNHISGFIPIIQGVYYTGTVEEVIAHTIKNYKVDMIVMGISQSGSLRNVIFSNHNTMMIAQTTVPLLLVPPAVSDTKIQRIAFATDLKYIEVDLKYIYALITFAKLVNADILIINIGDAHQPSPAAFQQKEKLLTRISNEADYPHIYYKFSNDIHVDAGLQLLCNTENISILSVVPRRRNLLESLIKPSITRKLIKNLSIPLLVFPQINIET